MFHSKLFSKLLLSNKLAADHQLASLNELILKPFDSSKMTEMKKLNINVL